MAGLLAVAVALLPLGRKCWWGLACRCSRAGGKSIHRSLTGGSENIFRKSTPESSFPFPPFRFLFYQITARGVLFCPDKALVADFAGVENVVVEIAIPNLLQSRLLLFIRA